MKTLIKPLFLKRITFIAITLFIYSSCKKEINEEQSKADDHGHLQQTKTFSAEVAQKWQDLQLRFLRTPTTVNPFGRHGHRYFAYCGIALYESVVPGMPAYQITLWPTYRHACNAVNTNRAKPIIGPPVQMQLLLT